MKIKKVLLNNGYLKLLALVLAFVTWVYVGELTEVDSGKTLLQRFFSASYFVSKKLYIQPNFTGEVAGGYKLEQDELKISPEFIVVLGPAKVLAAKEYIYTKPINLGEYTKSKTLDVELENISRSIKLEKTSVQVFLPITKTEPKEEAGQ